MVERRTQGHYQSDIGKGNVSLASFAAVIHDSQSPADPTPAVFHHCVDGDAAADFRFHSQSGRALSQTLPNRFTTAFRVVKIGTKGMWWWRKVVIQGLTRMTPEEVDIATEALLTEDDDYFLKF